MDTDYLGSRAKYNLTLVVKSSLIRFVLKFVFRRFLEKKVPQGLLFIAKYP